MYNNYYNKNICIELELNTPNIEIDLEMGAKGENGKDALINGVNKLNIVAGDNINLEQTDSTLTISGTYEYDDTNVKTEIAENTRNISNLGNKVDQNTKLIESNTQDINNLKQKSDDNKNSIDEINENLKNYSLITETGNKIDVTVNSSTYVMTLDLKDKNDNVLSTGSVDLPIESMIINVTYDSEKKELKFTLQNGNIINVPLNDLISGLVTDESLENTLKNYALKKDVPKKLSQLENDSNYVKNTDYATGTTAGVIKTNAGLDVDENGRVVANTYNYDEYESKTDNTFISKGTLENVITGKNLETANNKVTSVGTSSTDTEYPSAKCVYKIKEDVDNLKSDILETGETSDTFVHLEDSAMAEYQELSVDGICEQVTTSIANGDEYDSPSPDHPQEIKTIENSLKITSCNKNLFDMDYVKGSMYGSYTITNNIITFIPSETNKSSRIIIIIPKDKFIIGQKYTIKANGCTRITVGYSASVKDSSNHRYFADTIKGNNVSFTYSNIPTDYVCIYLYNAESTLGTNWTLSEIQLELGTTATSYEEYLETQITANLPEGEFIGKINDTYKDTLKVEYNEDDGQYHLNLYKNVGKVILDGSETWKYSNVVDNNYMFYTTLNLENYSTNYITDYFLTNNATYDSSTVGSYIFFNQLRFRFPNSIINSESTTALKNWLSNNPVTVYYALATPYTVDLGVVDMPLSYDEITNIFTDSDLLTTINAKYYRNFITTIRNLQVNEKALKQELIDINTRLSALENASASTVSDEK